MPTNHRGDFIAPNYRSTPRIAQAVATRLGNEAQNQAWRTSPNLHRALQAPSLENTQAALDNYRYNRDYNSAGIDADLMNHEAVEQTGKFIGDAVQRERTGSNYGPTEPYGK